MEYIVKMISERSQLAGCPVFNIDSFNWGGNYQPKTYGQMAFMEEEGFVLHMVCEESNPPCIYHKHNDPVYLDSAMEAFLAFDSLSDNYFNIEFNSYGAFLIGFGSGRSGRISVKEEDQTLFRCESTVLEDRWSVDLRIPLSLISAYFPNISLGENSRFHLNFYKLAEGEERTHFASFAPIHSPTPNFHLPEYFADAVIIR